VSGGGRKGEGGPGKGSRGKKGKKGNSSLLYDHGGSFGRRFLSFAKEGEKKKGRHAGLPVEGREGKNRRPRIDKETGLPAISFTGRGGGKKGIPFL